MMVVLRDKVGLRLWTSRPAETQLWTRRIWIVNLELQEVNTLMLEELHNRACVLVGYGATSIGKQHIIPPLDNLADTEDW